MAGKDSNSFEALLDKAAVFDQEIDTLIGDLYRQG